MSKSKSPENRKKAARVAAGPAAPGFARSIGESTSRLLRVFVPLVALAVVYAGLSFLLWRPVHGQPAQGFASQAHLNAAMIRNAVKSKSCPPWIPHSDFDQAADAGLIAVNHSVFESGLSRALAHAYERSPWVERVEALRLRYPAKLELEIDWRQPIARVDHSSLVLDRRGVVLNLMPDSPVAKNLPLITGVLCGRTEAGVQAPESDLLDALNLIAVVRETFTMSPGNLKITTVLREPAGTWRVGTDRGPTIYWGVFSDDPPVDEPRTREKEYLLRRRLCESKDPGLLEYIKVYHAQAPVKPRSVTTVSDAVGAAGGARARR